jgi:hypothetical protein
MKPHEEALDLYNAIVKAQKEFRNSVSKKEYLESEVRDRHAAILMLLCMARNEVYAMAQEWSSDFLKENVAK